MGLVIRDKTRSIRAVLAIFALCLVVPAVLAIGAVVAWNLLEVRHSQEAEMMALAHSASKTVDLRMTRIATMADAMTTSDAVLEKNWAAARARIARFEGAPILWVAVTDAQGRRLLDADAPWGPRAADVAAASRTRDAVVSDLFEETPGGRKVVAVSQRVEDDPDRTVVTVAADPAALLPTPRELAAPDVALITIVDGADRVAARSRNNERWQGTPATAPMIAAMRRSPDGLQSARSLDGEAMLVAYTRSPVSGWTTMVVVPRQTILRPVLRNGAAFILLAAVLLGLGLALSRVFGRGLIRDLHRLEEDAARLGHGEPVAVREGRVENIDRVQAALSAASGELERRASRQQLMINELNHRVKNTLATVQSLAMQTFRAGDAEAPAKLDKRLAALADAHDLLTQTSWEPVDIRSVVERCGRAAAGGLLFSGPSAVLPAQTALALCMCLHELVTNALKYGALSTPSGRVHVTWTLATDGAIDMTWREDGGPIVAAPSRQGFGAKLIDRLTRAEMGGTITRDFAPEGLTVTLHIAPPGDFRWNNDFG